MTGYFQPKEEWLAGMRAGHFRKHDAEERDLSLTVDGDAAQLVGRILPDATVYGARAKWRLELSMDFIRTDGGWLATRSEATTW